MMAVMNSPKMRVCRAMPAPDAMAAEMAMPWRVYSRVPANLKILLAGVSFHSSSVCGVSY